jgi:Fe-S cluster assembly iron-binding protein IscA
MALDEPQEKDTTIIEKGITFIMDKNLYDEAKPIHIDFVKAKEGSRIKFTTSLNLPPACGEE